MSEQERKPTMRIISPARRGRPREVEQGVPVLTWIPASEHARIQKIADYHGVSISAYIRSRLERR